ncbi:hypothetical protein BDW67DRAFT_169317 [Aspergillus spinulosporus]
MLTGVLEAYNVWSSRQMTSRIYLDSRRFAVRARFRPIIWSLSLAGRLGLATSSPYAQRKAFSLRSEGEKISHAACTFFSRTPRPFLPFLVLLPALLKGRVLIAWLIWLLALLANEMEAKISWYLTPGMGTIQPRLLPFACSPEYWRGPD